MRIDYMEFKRLMAPFGITDRNFLSGLYSQLMNADGFGSEGLEFAVSVITGSEPKDQFDVMQAAQAAVMHMAIMKNGRQLGRAEVGSPLQDRAERTVTKLSRNFTALIDSLKRHRGADERKVTVQHVLSVADGGQAIVGSMTQNALEEAADETPSLPAPDHSVDPESLEDEAIAWHDWGARQKRSTPALTNSSQPQVPHPDKSQSKPALVWHPGKPRRRQSSSEKTTALKGFRPADMPPPPRPRDLPRRRGKSFSK